MYRGRLVEAGPASRVYTPPSHPYTELLFRAMPRIGGQPGDQAPASDPALALVAAGAPATGCPFVAHCPRNLGEICRAQAPPWQETAEGHGYRCWIPPHELSQAQTGA
jgi:peptide/nickel transport system ATP-binding protein